MSAKHNWMVTVNRQTKTDVLWCDTEEEATSLARDMSFDNTEASVEIWQRFGSVHTVKTVTLTMPNDRKKELTK